MTNKANPLFDEQREKAGSQTIGKYLFQYHWALYKIISDHSEKKEYAVFIELHEDVVISNSLDSEKAKFEFNQIKATNTPFTTHQLVKTKKNGSSVLGKLIKGCNEKPFSKAIENINLVSINNYKLELKKGVELKKITLEDLTVNEHKVLLDELKSEIGITEFPKNLQFIVTDLPENNFQLVTIGAIANLIHSLFPSSYTDAKNIYSALIDDLLRKGRETADFTLWDDALKKKGLTSNQIIEVISQFTNIKDETKIDLEFNDVCKELNFNLILKKKMKQNFNRYRTSRISNRSTLQIDTTKFLLEAIKQQFTQGVTEIKDLISNIQKAIPQKLKKQFQSEEEITSAIICEFIMMN